jgi:putative secretion ATPase (PEP-CTERM system associated)
LYAEFYGLRAEPFLLTPDHQFYFESAGHVQAMAHLTYGLSRGEGFIIITGDVGAGKTTVVKKLCATLNSDQITAAHVVTTQLAGLDLLRMVAAAFGLKDQQTDKTGVLVQLQEYFEQTHRARKRALLIIDEGQNLTFDGLEELRMLSNFQIGPHAPFQCFLLGQPQFRQLLASPDLEQLRQRVIASYHLGPMSHEEVGEYLRHRMSLVGWKGDPTFEPSAVTAIFNHTGGVPRRINTLCSRVMLLGFLENLHSFNSDDVDQVVAELVDDGLSGDWGKPADAKPDEVTAQDAGLHHLNGGHKNGAMRPRSREGDLAERVAQLEERLDKQAELMRRASLVAYEFFHSGRASRTLD